MSNLHLVGACYPRRRQCHLRFKENPKKAANKLFFSKTLVWSSWQPPNGRSSSKKTQLWKNSELYWLSIYHGKPFVCLPATVSCSAAWYPTKMAPGLVEIPVSWILGPLGPGISRVSAAVVMRRDRDSHQGWPQGLPSASDIVSELSGRE